MTTMTKIAKNDNDNDKINCKFNNIKNKKISKTAVLQMTTLVAKIAELLAKKTTSMIVTMTSTTFDS